ncbi:hypothetical protein Nepgr_017878 [Nepenthes gracilis]|uniref:non-specific serine/threonine protein kinase n=1 Tax=Nepenthes gracilis TaxID=150966 RepID=A0AAD3ST40_NEPGR|nr:hypothetical protein Nepgr_017878 [Nepenthes gracilis]
MQIKKIKWKSILPGCCSSLKLQDHPETKRLEPPKQCSLQRISLLDIDNPDSQISINDLSSSLVGSNLYSFTLDELRKITNNFSLSNFIGEGGFGAVYKGFINDELRIGLEAQVVAVKVLDLEGSQGHKEWLAEVIFLGQLRHPNLVKLKGYCCENDQRLLVYEYLARGNLDSQLFSRHSITLPWLTRMKIGLEAAKGLAYLHGEYKPVIFRDFKSANILLDADYTAKLSDFGFARDGPGEDKSHITTQHIIGTKGYAAPEYIMTGHLTTMSDVYSFGVVLLELLTGSRSMEKKRPKRDKSLVEWARPFLKDPQKIERVMDPRLEGQYSSQGANVAAMLAYRCLSHHPKSRPTMSTVVQTLEPLINLHDDIPVLSDYSEKKCKEKDDYAMEVEEEKRTKKTSKGHRSRKKGHRHRHHQISYLRSQPVYSDTALYRTKTSSSNSADKQK